MSRYNSGKRQRLARCWRLSLTGKRGKIARGNRPFLGDTLSIVEPPGIDHRAAPRLTPADPFYARAHMSATWVLQVFGRCSTVAQNRLDMGPATDTAQ